MYTLVGHIHCFNSELDKQFLREIPNPDQPSPAAAASPLKRKRSLSRSDSFGPDPCQRPMSDMGLARNCRCVTSCAYASGVKLQLQVRLDLGLEFPVETACQGQSQNYGYGAPVCTGLSSNV